MTGQVNARSYLQRFNYHNQSKDWFIFFFFSPSLISPQSLIYEKYVYKRIEIITNNLKQLRDMGNLIKGLKVAAYVAEIIVAGSVVIELAEKYCGKFGKKKIATGEVKAVDAATEN